MSSISLILFCRLRDNCNASKCQAEILAGGTKVDVKVQNILPLGTLHEQELRPPLPAFRPLLVVGAAEGYSVELIDCCCL